jgi:hypothetical protein
MRSVEVSLALQVLLLLCESRLVVLYLPRGNVDSRLKVARIDLEEQVTLAHWLIISDGNPYNWTGDSRCDADNVCPNLAISRPGIFYVSRVE